MQQEKNELFSIIFKEQSKLMSSLMLYFCSIELMIKKYQLNEYYTHFINGLESNLLHLISCQSHLISAFTSSLLITKDELTRRLLDLHLAIATVRSTICPLLD